MATRITELEQWTSSEFERHLKQLTDSKYATVIKYWVDNDYKKSGIDGSSKLLYDDVSKIRGFDMDLAGRITQVEITLKGVKTGALREKEINEIVEIVRKLGYVDTPTQLTSDSLELRAKKDGKKFNFRYFYAEGLSKEASVTLIFPMEMKDEIPTIVKTFHEHLSKN